MKDKSNIESTKKSPSGDLGGINLKDLLRPNIYNLMPYSSARDEFTGTASVFLDANENPFETGYNRYPDPYQQILKKEIAKVKGVQPNTIFLGNGSDEPIDLLFRAFCNPGKDNVIAIEPSYGMYTVSADINDIQVKKVLLSEDFELDADTLLKKVDPSTKIIFLCSPNNPSGNLLNHDEIVKVINRFDGLVVVDEAYIDFAPGSTLLSEHEQYGNLIVLQTFSKAWGLAGIRLGMAFAAPEIIAVLNKIKYPYNINALTQERALQSLKEVEQKNSWVKTIIAEREKVAKELTRFPFVVKIFPSDANFLLVKMHDAKGIFNYLMDEGVIVRDRSRVALCEGSLRITIGNEAENEALIEKLEALV